MAGESIPHAFISETSTSFYKLSLGTINILALFPMDYIAKINSVELEIGELKNQLNEAIKNADREERIAIQNRITATQNTLNEYLRLFAPPAGKISSIFNFL
jgi:hypothetical protein